MTKEFTHELKEKFDYTPHGKGNFETAEIITVCAPKGGSVTLDVLDSICKRSENKLIKTFAGVFDSDKKQDLEKIQKEEKEKLEKIEEEEKPAEKQKRLEASYIEKYLTVLSGLETEKEIIQLNLCIKEIFKKAAQINNEKNLESSLFDELGYEDKKILIGGYIVNFIQA